MKFKGIQKQFELNAQIDGVFDRIRSANDSNNEWFGRWRKRAHS